MTNQVYDIFVSDESGGILVIKTLLVMNSLLEFDQKACQTDQFSLADQFYGCFACEKCHSSLIVTTLLVMNSILTFVQTACQTDHVSLTNQVYGFFVCDKYCVSFQILLPLTTTNYDGRRL